MDASYLQFYAVILQLAAVCTFDYDGHPKSDGSVTLRCGGTTSVWRPPGPPSERPPVKGPRLVLRKIQVDKLIEGDSEEHPRWAPDPRYYADSPAPTPPVLR